MSEGSPTGSLPATPVSSSSDPDVNPKVKRRKRYDGSSFRRHGRVLDVLRQQTAAAKSESTQMVAIANPLYQREAMSSMQAVALGNTNNTLLRDSMATSLTLNLINMANGLSTIPSTPPILDLAKIFNDYLKQGWRLREKDAKRECLIASLVALGARRSNHSSITGVLKSGNPDSSQSVELGRRREGTCRILANRAVDLAEECKLLEDPSEDAKQIAAVLRIAIYGSDPRHPFMLELVKHLHHHQTTNPPLDPSRSADFSRLSPVGYDSWLAVLNRVRPQITDKQLFEIYGWHRDKMPAAIKVLRNAKLDREVGATIATGLLRDLVSLQQFPECSIADLPKLTELLSHIFECLDALEECITRLKNDMFEAPVSFSSIGMAPFIGTIPMVGECVLAFDVERIVQTLAQTEPKVRELVLLTRLRLVAWLKNYTHIINIPEFAKEGANRHSLALLMSVLEVFPDWLAIAVEAARQYNAGEGPYTTLGYSWDDLKRLQTVLSYSATVFAKSSEQYNELTDALAKFNITSTPGSEFKDEGVLAEIVPVMVAQSMVSAALLDVSSLK